MSDTFADAMRVVAKDVLGLRDNFFGEQSDPVVDAILDMPEMRAIREVLGEVIDSTPFGCPYLLQDGREGAYGPNTCNQGCSDEPECMTGDYFRLPKSVIEWINP